MDDFNWEDEIFAFLLSSKAGGVGLNLIGASRLVLYLFLLQAMSKKEKCLTKKTNRSYSTSTGTHPRANKPWHVFGEKVKKDPYISTAC